MSEWQDRKTATAEQKQASNDGVYEMNLAWLKDQEAKNLGDGELQRHGEVGCHSTHSALGLPR